ncbi:uncharacterized protein TRAVEDRAFT_41684 [Trametes versicolor FP-101664 SS1]|uniref:uncharacterized protein n=1 Tax=Trametes versicolor (strain FP-101664) TaxID=717944 RepID=UPI0004622B07|nr:uncharacterized protein TRAVEDRAFT_41684 [Trametes versicolor FP-101664 SS1]EIW64264.1 hypothetical protein TRAVEDRAFT_41684 [Trametes versicolor FP-101664 SS1]
MSLSIGHWTIDGSLGPLFVGLVLASCLYGVTTFQTYIYFAHSSIDKMAMKILIFLLWILNTLRLAMVSYAAYTYMVTDFTNIFAILKPTWAIFPSTVVTVGLNNAVVRGVFCYRVWRLSGRNWWLASAIALTILTAFGANTAYAVISSGFQTWFDLPKVSWLLSFAFACSMAADILISASLCILLAMRKTGHARSDGILRTLIIYAINNAVISTACALACLITYLTMPDNFIFLSVYLIYPELILNALLATFNGRPALQRKMNMMTVTVQPAVLDSAQSRRDTHAKRKTKDVNITELGDPVDTEVSDKVYY